MSDSGVRQGKRLGEFSSLWCGEGAAGDVDCLSRGEFLEDAYRGTREERDMGNPMGRVEGWGVLQGV